MTGEDPNVMIECNEMAGCSGKTAMTRIEYEVASSEFVKRRTAHFH